MLMDLFIETLTGVSFELHVSPAETVMSIKSKIQRAEGIPVSQQHLIWQNDELDDHRRLRDYAISEGSTLRLVLGLRGGPLNAHRVPPLRLTPIQLAPSTPPNKYGSNSMNGSKHTHFSGSTSGITPHLPIPRTSLFPNDLRQNHSSLESTLLNRILNPLKKVTTSMKSDKSHAPSKSDFKHGLSDDEAKGTSSSEGTSKIPNSDTAQTEVNQPTSSRTSDPKKEDACDSDSQSNSDHEKTAAPPHLSSDKTKGKPETVSRDLGTASSNDVSTPTSQKQDDCDQPAYQCKATDYPPLLRSREASRPFYMHWSFREPLSSWRVCESHEAVPYSSNMLDAKTASKIDKMPKQTEQPSDDVDRPARGDGLNFLSTANNTDSGEKLDKISDSVPTSAAAATLLATLLAATGDHSESLSYQATQAFGRLRYPYHWLRKASPLPEENEPQHPLIATGFWDTEDCEDDRDTLGANIYDAESDQDDEDPDEDENSDTKEAYCCGVDDDDSLADLEDYLFYYRTGDLLFGPPSISTGYPPYSCYAVRDPYGLDQWNTDLDRDLGGIRTTDSADADSNLHNETAWRHEYNQLTEKVKNLKTRMKNVRARRLGRKQNSKTADVETTEENATKCEVSPDFQQDSNICDNKQESSKNPIIPLSSETSDPPVSPSSNSEKKQRRRRFGTVTPPDVKFLIQIPSNSHCSVLPPNSISLTHETEPELDLLTQRTCAPTNKPPISSLSNSRKSISAIFRTDSTPAEPNTTTTTINKNCSLKSSSPELDLLAKLTSPGPEISSTVRLSTSEDRTFPRKISTADSKIPVSSSQFLPTLVTTTPSGLVSTRLLASSEGRIRVSSRLVTTNTGIRELNPDLNNSVAHTKTKSHPRTPPGPNLASSTSICRKRCALCLRRIGLANSYSCRCGRNFCARHRYAEVHSCPFDYKSEARRYLMESNPVVTAPKLPKI